MSNLFSHAGVSRQNGSFKVRFCNDALRVKVLAKNGHKDIDVIELREPMTKEAAIAYLLSIDFDNGNKEVRAALEAAQESRSGNKDSVKKAPKAKKSPSLDAIAARAKATKAPATVDAALEDAPY